MLYLYRLYMFCVCSTPNHHDFFLFSFSHQRQLLCVCVENINVYTHFVFDIEWFGVVGLKKRRCQFLSSYLYEYALFLCLFQYICGVFSQRYLLIGIDELLHFNLIFNAYYYVVRTMCIHFNRNLTKIEESKRKAVNKINKKHFARHILALTLMCIIIFNSR